MITPSDLVSEKPAVSTIWRQEARRCDYDHKAQVRNWQQSEIMQQVMATTGSPTSSTAFDGESDE
ncbi:MAG TPA: hypothetical protein VFY13_01030 [Luteolibacter sp.]|nr:hypothetical protein [Luteolibacter sp.]